MLFHIDLGFETQMDAMDPNGKVPAMVKDLPNIEIYFLKSIPIKGPFYFVLTIMVLCLIDMDSGIQSRILVDAVVDHCTYFCVILVMVN